MWTVALSLLKNRTVVTAVAVIALFFGGYIYGFETATWKAEADKLSSVQRAIEEYEEVDRVREEFDSETIKELKEQLKGYINGKEKVRIYIKANPDTANRECLDADGLRLYNLGPNSET